MIRMILLSMLLSIALFAQRYEAKTTQELQAQAQLLSELYEDQMISKDDYHQEKQRLDARAKLLTHEQIDDIDANNIDTVQSFSWLSTALISISAIITVIIFFPFLRQLYDHLKVMVKKVTYFLMIYLSWIKPIKRLFLRFYYFIKKSVLYSLKKLKAWILKIPKWFWEPFWYVLFFAMLVGFESFYLDLIASILISLLIGGSLEKHVTFKEKENFVKLYLAILALYWAILAYVLASTLFGFVAVMFINALFGFFVVVQPGLMTMGFQGEGQPYYFRVTLVSLALLVVGWLVFHTSYLPDMVEQHLFMYETGLFVFVPISFYLALLILTGIWYIEKNHYELYLLYALVMGSLLIFVAYIYGMGFLFWIGSFFMLWLLASKYYEMIYLIIPGLYAWALLALILGLLGYYLERYLQEIIIFLEPVLRSIK